jgi:feruloyl esterase
VDVRQRISITHVAVANVLGLDYNGLTYTADHGFATVASNNGHNGTRGVSFFNNRDVVEDFAGRS